MKDILRHSCLSAVIVALLSSCATVDFDYPKTATSALTNTQNTYLGKLLSNLPEKHPGMAGFYPMFDGIDALSARLLLAERAERTIDAQYYLITNDLVGYAFINALLRAADRGVRVRLLLDDILTKNYDVGLAALDSHPNFEVRIFNPFAWRSARFIDGLTGFSRINRRMHNKSFTVDNQVTIIGGRNIAAEYFGARADKKFADLDVAAIGPIVGEVSNMFDSYWNHKAAAPLPAFMKIPDDPAAALLLLREKIETASEEILDTPYSKAVKTHVLAIVESHESLVTWAPYTLAFDSPDKVQKKLAKDVPSIRAPLIKSLGSANNEVVIISPYFVPRKTGTSNLVAMKKRGVDVTIITNSLAANNQAAVHGGYAPARKALIKEGIRIYEMRPDASVPGAEIAALSSARATLHTKAFIVDRSEIFIGSFNFDPRSAFINTELGVIIESPEIAAPVVENLFDHLPTQAYEIFLNEKGKLRWRSIENGKQIILDKEPQTTWWQRFVAGFMRILPIRGQL